MCSLTSDDVMAYFDPRKKSVLIVDASPVGLGAMLIQHGKVIACVSKALSSAKGITLRLSVKQWLSCRAATISGCICWEATSK